MLHAVEEFFPESGILDESEPFVKDVKLASVSSRDDNALRRIETGISSIVGPNNGDRPGGFVLVIDGTALDYASTVFVSICASLLIFVSGFG